MHLLYACTESCTMVIILFWQTAEKLKIDLVIEMGRLKKVHPVLEGIIMDAALKAVDALIKVSLINMMHICTCSQ